MVLRRNLWFGGWGRCRAAWRRRFRCSWAPLDWNFLCDTLGHADHHIDFSPESGESFLNGAMQVTCRLMREEPLVGNGTDQSRFRPIGDRRQELEKTGTNVFFKDQMKTSCRFGWIEYFDELSHFAVRP